MRLSVLSQRREGERELVSLNGQRRGGVPIDVRRRGERTHHPPAESVERLRVDLFSEKDELSAEMELHRVGLTQRELQALAGLRRDVDMTRMSRVVVPGCHLDLPDSEPRPVACSARRSNREAFLKPPTLARAP